MRQPQSREGVMNAMLDLSQIKITPRDHQVLDLLVQGCSNKEIAAELNISPRTVKQHLRTLFLRAGIKEGRKRVKLAQTFRLKQNQSHTVGNQRPSEALAALIEHDSEHNFAHSNLQTSVEVPITL